MQNIRFVEIIIIIKPPDSGGFMIINKSS